MKKIAILVVFALVAAGAFAQISRSAGGGLFLERVNNCGVDYTIGGTAYYDGIIIKPFSGFLFFDATYAELGISFANAKMNRKSSGPGGSGQGYLGRLKQVGFTLLGKYPIEWRSFVIFPLFGVGYNLVTGGEYEGGVKIKDPGDYSQFGILGGAGLDYDLRESLYLRAEVLYQLRFASKDQKNGVDFVKETWSATGSREPLIKLTQITGSRGFYPRGFKGVRLESS
jgi:opacity protein-like surface antigen